MDPLDVSLFELHLENLERLGWTPEDTIDLLAFVRERIDGKQLTESSLLSWNVIDAKTRNDGLYAVVEKMSPAA